jgi:hypothetical protein
LTVAVVVWQFWVAVAVVESLEWGGLRQYWPR